MVVKRQTGLKGKNSPHTNNRDENKRRGPPYKSTFPPGGHRKQYKKRPRWRRYVVYEYYLKANIPKTENRFINDN